MLHVFFPNEPCSLIPFMIANLQTSKATDDWCALPVTVGTGFLVLVTLRDSSISGMLVLCVCVCVLAIKGKTHQRNFSNLSHERDLEHPKQSPKSKHHVPALIASSGIAFLTLEFQSVVSRKPQTGHSSKSTCLPWPLTALKTCPTHQH